MAAFVTNAGARAPAIPELNGITAANANFTFVGGGAVPANTLLFANRFTDRDRPMHDFTAELNLTKELTTGSARHTFTLGGFYGDAAARDINVTTTYLAEFNNQPRLVNLTVTNPITGVQTIISRNGLLNAGGGYVNNRHEATRYAAYFADQIEADRWAFDIGVRIEHFSGDISRERTSTFITDTTTPNLSAALRDVIWGNDGFLTGRVEHDRMGGRGGRPLPDHAQRQRLRQRLARLFLPRDPRRRLPRRFRRRPPPASRRRPKLYRRDHQAGRRRHPIQQPTASRPRWPASTPRLTNRRQVLFINDPANPGGFTEQVNHRRHRILRARGDACACGWSITSISRAI